MAGYYCNRRFLLVPLILILLLTDQLNGCGPGRGSGNRRKPRKLTPLVFKQHVPNVSENTLGASGLSEGRISRDDRRFQDLVPNYNPDIIFKDEEGTGADRLMTQRCKEKLNTLAISVMNQWPGVKLRVTEGWDEEGHHAPDSLHYEGRAVDISTSDRDRSKYGMLARLAVEAGFDWVYYESRSHIHCSVKSESSRDYKGCFPANSSVVTKTGRKAMSDLAVGDEVRGVNNDGQLVFTEVLMFLDRDEDAKRLFYRIETESGHHIMLTPAHLIFVEDSSNELVVSSNNNDVNNRTWMKVATTQTKARSDVVTTFARNVLPGDVVHVINSDESISRQRVVSVTTVEMQGVYAPLTSRGSVVVNDVVVSCYAVIDDQTLAHVVFAPVRLYNNAKDALKYLFQKINVLRLFTNRFVTENRKQQRRTRQTVGVHWYARFLYEIAQIVLPSQMIFN